MPAYRLFLDESGDFTEGKKAKKAASPQSYPPSLFAGYIVPPEPSISGMPIEQAATAILTAAYKKAGRNLPNKIHATNHWTKKSMNFDKMLIELVSQLRKAGWQPVRLVNADQIDCNNRERTYTRILAELALGICQEKIAQGEMPGTLHFFCDNLSLWKNQIIKPQEYKKSLAEAFEFASMRQGISGWEFDSNIQLKRAQEWRPLQICDLLSHATYNNYAKCGDEARKALEEGFGPYNFTLHLRELRERINLLREEGSIGQAVTVVAKDLLKRDAEDQQANHWLEGLLKDLAGRSAISRNGQLAIVINWLEQMIDVQRKLPFGHKLSRWLVENVASPLRKSFGSNSGELHTLDWFSWALHLWALTASNHLGELQNAQAEVNALQELKPRLVGQWEYAPLLMHGLLAQAVHRTDCFKHQEASVLAKTVADYYKDLADLFQNPMPGHLPESKSVHSSWRGRALGTLVQSETFAFLIDGKPTHLDKAREASKLAIEEFAAESDKQRQYQYRCQLETAAEKLDEARKALAQGVGLPENATHHQIAKTINDLGATAPVAQRFALLHWLRLGNVACRHGGEQRKRFLTALQEKTAFLNKPWGTSDDGHYPEHGILRYIAAIHAQRSTWQQALPPLNKLCMELNPIAKGQVVLGTVQLAALAEVAGWLWDKDHASAVELLNNWMESWNHFETIAKPFPRIMEVFQDWPGFIKSCLNKASSPAETIRGHLLKLAWRVGY